MRVRLFVTFILVVGVVAPAPSGLRLSTKQGDSRIVGNEACIQDFPNTTSPDPRATVVMCGLDNPRGLAFFESRRAADDDLQLQGDDDSGSDAALYVAEAGRGAFPQITGNCFAGQAGGTRCYGPTGAISRLWKGVQEQVVTELPSHANLAGRQAIGPHDIALVIGRGDGDRDHEDHGDHGDHGDRGGWTRATGTSTECDPACAYVTIGLMQPPQVRIDNEFLENFAKLARVSAGGQLKYIADLGRYEAISNPDRAQLDTNPYGLLAEPSGSALVVADAGGNSMLRIGAHGKISTQAVFRPHADGSDSVPTSVAVGPDGAHYVGELSGIPLVSGAANIYRVGHAGERPEACVTGFTAIIDIAFDKPGNLYVLEYTTGTLFRVAPDRRATPNRGQSGICAQYDAGAQTKTTVVSGLTNPTAVVVGPDGAFYISNRGNSPATGEVIRFEPLKIAFTRLREDIGIPGSTEQLEAEIWVMNGDGSEPRRLTYNTADDLGAVWSPDGKTVAFYGVQFTPGTGGTLVGGPPNIFLIDAAGGPQRLLTGGRFPSWSPDGKRIAFDSSGAGSNIFTINPDGSGLEQLTHETAGRNIRPHWSPDGQKIAFARGPNGREEIWVMNTDGSEPRQLTLNNAGDNAPSWSPDGRLILFQSNRDGNDEIYVMNEDGSDQTNLSRNVRGRDLDADWSPDGRTIAFQRDIEPVEAQILQVFVMNADGTQVRPLTALPSENGHPGWGRERAVKPRR
jgi:Tol biopolymer transport system component